MPTYDYQCKDCGLTFEVFATFRQKEAGLKPECPQCHSTAIQQAFHSLMFIRSSDGGGDKSTPRAGCGPTCTGIC